jgi:hypothetical protein
MIAFIFLIFFNNFRLENFICALTDIFGSLVNLFNSCNENYAAENCDSKVSKIESCDPWSVMKDVESKVDSSLKTASTFLKNNNPFAKFADRFKNISGESVVEKADKLRQTATGHVEKMVQSAKTGGKSLANSGKSLADKAKQFFANAKESINN